MNHNDYESQDLYSFLEKIPLFSPVPRNKLTEISGLFEIVFPRKGETIFKKGEPGDSMYILKSGSVGIYASGGSSNNIISNLHRGDFFGELCLLTERPRLSTAKVTLDACLYKLEKPRFEKLLRENPSVGLFLSRLYAHRFAESSHQTLSTPLPKLFAVLSTHEQAGKSYFLYSLAYHLATETHRKGLVIDFENCLSEEQNRFELVKSAHKHADVLNSFKPFSSENVKPWYRHESGFYAFDVSKQGKSLYRNYFAENIQGVLENLRAKFDFVLFNLTGPNHSALETEILKRCDKIFILMHNTKEGLESVKRYISKVKSVFSGRYDNIKVGVSHLVGEKGIPRDILETELDLAETPAVWADRLPAAFEGRIDTEKKFPVQGPRALARELCGIRIGLALGAGGARGWAHLGVLKVLEENHIPVDLIAGTSIGALVGTAYSRIGSAGELKKLTIDKFKTREEVRRKIFDYTFPKYGIIRGQKIIRLLRDTLKNADFLDLLIPSYIVAVDIDTGEEVLFERGSVSDAVRASISIPGIFNPFYHNRRWLLDGGLLNPVPADILIQKGADIIIAVCIEQNLGKHPPGRLSPPSILKVLTQSVNIVHARNTKEYADKADIVLFPRVENFAWDDFHKGGALMKEGENETLRHLDDIKALMGKKMNPSR